MAKHEVCVNKPSQARSGKIWQAATESYLERTQTVVSKDKPSALFDYCRRLLYFFRGVSPSGPFLATAGVFTEFFISWND